MTKRQVEKLEKKVKKTKLLVEKIEGELDEKHKSYGEAGEHASLYASNLSSDPDENDLCEAESLVEELRTMEKFALETEDLEVDLDDAKTAWEEAVEERKKAWALMGRKR
jgi:hypothetical protein